MARPCDPITDREKAAIAAYKLGLFPDQKAAFIAADDKPEKAARALKGLNQAASRWMKSTKIVQFSEYIDRLLMDRDADARQRGRDEVQQGRTPGGSDRTDDSRRAAVDYYDPANQKRQINRIIQEARDDPKTQLDAIKAIQQTQRDDRQAARDQKQVKTYLPLRCSACPLMMKARKRQQEGQNTI